MILGLNNTRGIWVTVNKKSVYISKSGIILGGDVSAKQLGKNIYKAFLIGATQNYGENAHENSIPEAYHTAQRPDDQLDKWEAENQDAWGNKSKNNPHYHLGNSNVMYCDHTNGNGKYIQYEDKDHPIWVSDNDKKSSIKSLLDRLEREIRKDYDSPGINIYSPTNNNVWVALHRLNARVDPPYAYLDNCKITVSDDGKVKIDGQGSSTVAQKISNIFKELETNEDKSIWDQPFGHQIVYPFGHLST